MTQVTPQERWFLVNQLLILTEKEVKERVWNNFPKL